MRGRREEHNIIGRGRCVHSFIQNNFVITKPSVFAPLQTSSCCYCGKGPQWRPPMKWFRMLWFKAKGPVHRFLQLTLSVLIYSAQVDALVMWSRGQRPSQHKVKLGYAQTYLDDKRLAMDIHFLLSLCRQSRRFYSKLKYLLIPWTGSAKSIRGSPMQNEVKRGHRPFQLCRGKIWTLWRLMQNRKRSLDKNKAFRRIRQQLGCSTSAIHRKQKCIYPCMPRWDLW